MKQKSGEYVKLTLCELLAMCQADQDRSDGDMAIALRVSEAVYAKVKSGHMKLPIANTRRWAESLRLPAEVLLIAALQEYQPELLAVFCDVFEPFPLSAEERASILQARTAT